MQKVNRSLRLEVRQAPHTSDCFFAWGDAAVSMLFLAGLCLLLTKNFSFIPWPWWVLTAFASVFCILLLGLYGVTAGKWIAPAGIGVAVLVCIMFHKKVLSGFGCFGNDVLAMLTNKIGQISLDFSVADFENLPWCLIPLLVVCTLLITHSVWSGRFADVLPILLPIYAAVFVGLIPCDFACGLLMTATVMLLIQCTGKDTMTEHPMNGIPTHFLILILCAGLCMIVSTQAQGLMNTDFSQKIRDSVHESFYDSDSNSMPEGKLKNLTPWKKNDTPALEVTMDEPVKMYLRGSIYETYTGTRWEQAAAEDRAAYEDLYYWLHRSGFFGQSQIGTAAGLTGQTELANMTVRNLSACSAHGYYPYAVFGSDSLRAERIGDTELPTVETMQYLPGSLPEWYRIQNNLSSAQGRENIEHYLRLEQSYSDYVKAFDLQLTQDSWSVLDRQIGEENESFTIGQIRELIRNYLDENMTYDETIRTMNGNGDFLQYTLERSGCGYSVHYATAAVLMLRYFGVPARYVEGYYLSREEASHHGSGQTITLTEEHAHAWAEYYVSGVGFVPFEVTPGYIDDEELELGSGSFTDQNTYHSSQQFVQVQKPEDIELREQDRAVFPMNIKWMMLLLLLPLIGLITLIVLRRIWLNKALKAIEEANIRDSITMRYGYAMHLLKHSTAAPPEGAEEAAVLNMEALFSCHEMTNAQRKIMDDYAEQVLNACKNSWSRLQRLRYRLWDCLY